MDAFTKGSVYVTYINSVALVILGFYVKKKFDSLEDEIGKLKTQDGKTQESLKGIAQEVVRLHGSAESTGKIIAKLNKMMMQMRRRLDDIEVNIDAILGKMKNEGHEVVIPGNDIKRPSHSRKRTDIETSDSDDIEGTVRTVREARRS